MTPRGPCIRSRILPLENPGSYVKLVDYQFMKEYLMARGRKDVKAKITVTGPVTFGFS